LSNVEIARCPEEDSRIRAPTFFVADLSHHHNDE
jgi:hypothetical protein